MLMLRNMYTLHFHTISNSKKCIFYAFGALFELKYGYLKYQRSDNVRMLNFFNDKDEEIDLKLF